MENWKLSDEILACAVPACRLSQLQPVLVDAVNLLVSRLSFCPRITSAFRSQDWDRVKGRSGASAHCKGLAVDIACVTSAQRYEILRAAISLQIPRIGIGRNFIHLDLDPDKAQDVVWHYYAK